MRKFLGLVFFVCSVYHVFCQNNLPPAYEIKKDAAYGDVVIPDSCWQMLEDPEGKLSFDQVSESALAGNFHSDTRINSSVNRYWVRYRLKNEMTHDAKICFASGLASYLDLFVKRADSGWEHKKSGYLRPWSE